MIRRVSIEVAVGYNKDVYGQLPVKPRDLKALAAMLSMIADAPEMVDTTVGPFHLRVEVDDEV